MEKYYKIGEISKLYKIGVDSLRYYEEIGLIHPKRAESKYRLYSVKDIWRLNVIRELRELDFTMDQIKEYLDNHNTTSTLKILNEEELLIDEKIKELKELKKNVKKRMTNIVEAYASPLNEVIVKEYDTRYCYQIDEDYTNGDEMDVLIKKLININNDKFYIIGSNKIGSVIKLDEFINQDKKAPIHYSSVFLMDQKGKRELPKGRYLSIAYQGNYINTKIYIKDLVDYAKVHHLEVDNDILEILWVDIHTSSIEKEHITELQLRIKD